jgi:hypothetical protein
VDLPVRNHVSQLSSELVTLPRSGESELQMVEIAESTFLRKRLDNLVEFLRGC